MATVAGRPWSRPTSWCRSNSGNDHERRPDPGTTRSDRRPHLSALRATSVWGVDLGHGQVSVRHSRSLAPGRAGGIRLSDVSTTVPNYRWSPSEFVRAWEAGSFDHRVEMIDGEVWLVVEVSDETLLADLAVKANIYGAAGWSVYWVVSKEAIYEHTEPTPAGYRTRIEYRRGDRLPIRYAETDILVDDLLGPL